MEVTSNVTPEAWQVGGEKHTGKEKKTKRGESEEGGH